MNNSEKLIKLIKENPELPVVPMVWHELCGDDHSYWMGGWGETRLDYYYHSDERIYFKTKDEEELENDLLENDEWLSEDDAKIKVHNYKWIKCITMSIELP